MLNVGQQILHNCIALNFFEDEDAITPLDKHFNLDWLYNNVQLTWPTECQMSQYSLAADIFHHDTFICCLEWIWNRSSNGANHKVESAQKPLYQEQLFFIIWIAFWRIHMWLVIYLVLRDAWTRQQDHDKLQGPFMLSSSISKGSAGAVSICC